VLPDRTLSPGTLVIDGDRIVEIRPGAAPGTTAGSQAAPSPAFHGQYIIPGFIDVHVHGVDGVDSLDDGEAVSAIASSLPRYGVTAFCPTTVACGPAALRRVLQQVREARHSPPARAARVLAAHLESNFINPEFRGAQPVGCLRSPLAGLIGLPHVPESTTADLQEFSAADLLREIERAAADVGIVTLAPELDGGIDLVRWLLARGHRVSLGHSGATYDQALEAIAAGARHATHLFNRMPPLGHRSPGLVGAILQAEEVAAELICDGFHVHPTLVRTAIAAKGPSRIMAITDGTAASGLPAGARATLGGEPITAGESAAFLEDGTIAGSILTMDGAFRMLVNKVGLSLIDAVTVCSTTPAGELGLAGQGVIAAGATADLVVLDAQLSVLQTYVGGKLAYTRN
jgi:N-acetylglucosamine-6-phosphate deacetylase